MSDQTIWTEERKALARQSFAKWHGTPHRDRIAIVGVGIDCINYIVEILTDATIVDRRPFNGYKLDHGTFKQSQRLHAAVTNALHVVPLAHDAPPEFGDIWSFATGQRSGHCAIVGEDCLWHAMGNNRVTFTELARWKPELDTAYRITSCGWKTDPQTVCTLIEK
jgi:hypothetical protein